MRAGLGPTVICLGLVCSGELVDCEVSVSIGAVGIHIHDGLNE